MKSITVTKLGRTLRYARASLDAWRMHNGRDELVRQRAGRHLRDRLGRLRGLPQKVGQMLSMTSDTEQADLFIPLGSAAPALDFADLTPHLELAWGKQPNEICQEINPEGLAASLGQVHQARLHDGRQVAVKIQYPGMSEALDTDLSALGWIARPVGNLRDGFDMTDYQNALRESLKEELDYEAEAANQKDMARAAADSKLDLVVPTVIDELSTDKVLTSTWEEGGTHLHTRTWEAPERGLLGRRMVSQFLTMIFDHGLMHADPHPGNYRFRLGADGPQVVLYDYGCVHRMTERERMVLLRLITEASNSSSKADPFPLLVELGFDADLLKPLRHKLPALCRILFEPFSKGGKFDMDSWNLSERVSDVLGDDRMNFRIAGPAKLMFFLRAFHGLRFHLAELGEPVSWSIPMRELQLRHGPAMAALEFSEPASKDSSYSGLATSLCIQVSEHGETKARITLPATAVERLESFVDEDLQAKIDAREIDLDAIVSRVRAQQFAPQSIFSLEDGDKHIVIWLE
ncbi:MAG: putative unusual protein kinase regulating ubiquinone biosynthesis (AarF/ABC1/UbiB family) [Planctomycetota bacterium]|jgi:predicted unusual protein kinase regulating ubiquinone biosynthesis (AarF/ABC1/UbiB family)